MRADIRETLRLALPVMGARAGILVMTTVDTILTGRFGADELAFYAIGNAAFLFLMLLGIGLATGAAVLVAQARGAGDPLAAGRIWKIACLDMIVLGIVSGLLLLPGEAILRLLGQPPEIVVGGARVMRAFALAMPAVLLFSVTSFFLEAIGRPHAGLLVMILGNLLNLLFDWLLMFGPFGLPMLGAEGSAIGTSITRWIMAGLLIRYAFRFAGHEAFGVRAPLGRTVETRRQLLRLGLPFAASQGLESSAFQFILVMAGWLGTAALAAHQAAINLNALVYMLTLGLATATSVRVGHATGRNDPAASARAGWTGVGLGVLIMLCLIPLILVFARDIGLAYSSDPAVVATIVAALMVVCPTMTFDSAQGTLTAALRGTSDTWIPTAIHVACFWPVMVGLAWYLGIHHGMGVVGLWWGLLTGLAMAALILGLRFWNRTRQNEVPLPSALP